MANNKDEREAQEQLEEFRNFLKNSIDLQKSGTLTQEEEDKLDEEFGAYLRSFLYPQEKEVVKGINPPAYRELFRVRNALLDVGFDEREVDIKLSNHFTAGTVSGKAPEIYFDCDEAEILSNTMELCSAFSLYPVLDGRVEMSFTIPDVLKELE